MLSIASSLSSRSQQLGLRWRVTLLLLSVAVLTIGLKVIHYGLHLSEVIETRQQQEVDAFMQQHGWSHAGNQGVELSGFIQARRYAGGACSGEIRILFIDSNGDMTDMIDDFPQKDDRLFFVHDGATSEQPPQYAPFRQELRRVLRNLQLLKAPAHPDLAIAGPPTCHIETAVPWSSL